MKLPGKGFAIFRTGLNRKDLVIALQELKKNGWYEALRKTQDREHFRDYVVRYANHLYSIKIDNQKGGVDSLFNVSDEVHLNSKAKIEEEFALLTQGYVANQRAIKTGLAPSVEDLEAISLFI